MQTTATSAHFLELLNLADREKLIGLGRRVNLPKGGMAFSAGDRVNSLFITLAGRMKVLHTTESGKEVILWFCGAGDVFGLAEVMRSGDREVRAQACSPATLLRIPASTFRQYLLQRPSAALVVIELLALRLRNLGEVLTDVAGENVPDRLLKLLVRLSLGEGHPASPTPPGPSGAAAVEVFVDMKLTHQDMADMIGASRQTVTSTLGGLKRRGIVRVGSDGMYIDGGAVERLSKN